MEGRVPAVSDAHYTLVARALHRPAIFPVPAFALRLFLGKMADEALLASFRVIPDRLQQSGFKFEDVDLEAALRRILRPRRGGGFVGFG